MTDLDIEASVAERRGYSGTEYLDTIALLQEEIARLEQELESRALAPPETEHPGLVSAESETASSAAIETAAAAHREIERLKGDLARGEETIALLLEQLGLLEESNAASRAEWEQLTQWVAALEERVEGQDGDALRRLEARLEGKERETQELRAQSEERRRGWEVQERVYEATVARLRGELAHAQDALQAAGDGARPAGPASQVDIDELERLRDENLRLRARLEVVERTAAESSDKVHARLAQLDNERDALARELQQAEDLRRRQELEHEAALAELRTRHSQASLVQSDPARSPRQPEDQKKDLGPDARIRALRQHLLEIHQREQEERRQRTLSARLSRLWSRTSPR